MDCRHYLRTSSSNRWLEVSTYTRKILRLAKLIQISLGFLRCQMSSQLVRQYSPQSKKRSARESGRV